MYVNTYRDIDTDKCFSSYFNGNYFSVRSSLILLEYRSLKRQCIFLSIIRGVFHKENVAVFLLI